jgi:uncharacterized protein (TIGR02001 family)
MRNLRILAALVLIAAAGAAHADVTGSVSIVSDYDFRGITQTNGDPAVQMSIDYTHESGFYFGAWGSNIDWLPKATTEVDLYSGFRSTVGDLGWDVGIYYYSYPSDSEVNTYEIYGKLTYKFLTGSLWYTDDFYNSGKSEVYLSADAAIPAGPLSIILHAGYTSTDAVANGDYEDYAVGVSYTASNITLSMKYIFTDGVDRFGASPGSDDRVVLGISTSLPWK